MDILNMCNEVRQPKPHIEQKPADINFVLTPSKTKFIKFPANNKPICQNYMNICLDDNVLKEV